MNDYTDTHHLIAAYLAGDQIAIDRLIQNYRAGVYRLAISILDDPAEADEAAQDAFIAAVNRLASYQPRHSFKAWLYTITVNTCLSRLRKGRAISNLWNLLKNIGLVQAQSTPSPEEQVMRNEKDAALWKAISGLSEKHRIPLVLRYFNDFSIAEIAEILNTHEGTIHSRLHSARDRLRTEIERLVE